MGRALNLSLTLALTLNPNPDPNSNPNPDPDPDPNPSPNPNPNPNPDRCISHAEKAVVVDRLLLQQQLIEGEERRAAKRTASDSKTDGAPSKEALLATAMARDAVGTLSSGIASAPPPLLRGEG